MFLMGEEGKPPIQMSEPQAWLHAGARGRRGLDDRALRAPKDGLGQHIVVNAQACGVWTLMNEQAMPLLHGDYLRRNSVFTGAIGGRRKTVYQCKDGHISFLLAGGAYFNSSNAVIAWMREEGAAPDWLARGRRAENADAGGFMAASAADLKELDDAEEAMQRFFLGKTKKEMWENILKRRLFGATVANAADIAEDPQLKAREYFVKVDHARTRTRVHAAGCFRETERDAGRSRKAQRRSSENTIAKSTAACWD